MLLQRLLIAAMAAGALILLALPWIVYWALRYYELPASFDRQYYITSLCFLYPSGFLGMGILYNAAKILAKVNCDEPFIEENVRRVKYIARICAVLCCLYAAGIFFMRSFFVPILFIVFGLTALFLSVFGELFKKAVEYKNDNDFTI